jgi:hypothetical protein
MQQFVVPQFIDVEDKVIGPVTVRQFIIVLVGAGLDFIAFKLADFTLFLAEFIAISFISFSLAFIKVNGRPMHYFLLNMVQTFKRPHLRIWYKKFSQDQLKKYSKIENPVVAVSVQAKTQLRSSRLTEIALIVDTGGVYQGEPEPIPINIKQKNKSNAFV